MVVQSVELGQHVVINSLQVAEVNGLFAIASASGRGEIQGTIGSHIVEHRRHLQTTVSGNHVVATQGHITRKGFVTTNGLVFSLGYIIAQVGRSEIVA